MSQNELLSLEAMIELITKYEQDAKDLETKANSLNTIKGVMTRQGIEELTTPNYVARFIDIISTRFDTKRFKKELGEDIYLHYTKQVASKKFTIYHSSFPSPLST